MKRFPPCQACSEEAVQSSAREGKATAGDLIRVGEEQPYEGRDKGGKRGGLSEGRLLGNGKRKRKTWRSRSDQQEREFFFLFVSFRPPRDTSFVGLRLLAGVRSCGAAAVADHSRGLWAEQWQCKIKYNNTKYHTNPITVCFLSVCLPVWVCLSDCCMCFCLVLIFCLSVISV